MLAARFHGSTKRYGEEAEVGTNDYACKPQCRREHRPGTSIPNSIERRIVMILGDLFGSLGGIGDWLAQLFGVIEAILGLFTSLGG
jgi:hypothetical protein